MPCDLRPLRPGDEIELSREHVVTVSATKHTVPSLGFVVWERRRKLKPEYAHLAGHEIRDLRLAGTEVSEERRIAPRGLSGRQFTRGARRHAGHVRGPGVDHGDHVRGPVASQGQDPQIRPHAFGRHRRAARAVSQRSDHRLALQHPLSSKRIKDLVARALPDALDGRLHLWL